MSATHEGRALLMNSITRPRRRPRKQSVNFRSIYWLVRMEAAVEIYYGGWMNTWDPHFRRILINSGPRAWACVIRRARASLAANARRFAP